MKRQRSRRTSLRRASPFSRMIGLLTAEASTNCSAMDSSLESFPNTTRLVSSIPCSGAPPVRCASHEVVGGPSLERGVVTAAGQLAIDDGRQPPLGELAAQFRHGAFVCVGRRVVDHAHELHRQRGTADAEARPLARDRAQQRRVGDLEDAGQIDAERISPRADVAILVVDEALPVEGRHVADGNGFVVGIGRCSRRRRCAASV